MEQTKQLLGSYLRVTQQMSRQFRSYFSQLDLTFPQALVLTVLGEEGPIPISRLAQLTGSANSTVSGIVDRLERLNLVERTRSEEDRRVIYVTLTEQYRELHRQTAPSVSAYLDRMLRTLSAEEMDQICAALDKLDTTLRQAEAK